MTVDEQPRLDLGLSDEVVAQRRARSGWNDLPRPATVPVARQLTAQLTHFFAILLWFAAGLAAIARMPQLAVAIVAVVVINGLFAFLQEHRAERAAASLRDLLPRRATVRRNGRIAVIDARELVPGDVVLIAAGDRLSADLRLADATALAVDTSTMTGESVPIRPEAGDEVFAGSLVVEGEATAVVESVGVATKLAELAHLTTGARHQTPLAAELHRLVRRLAVIAVAVGVGFFSLAVAIGMPAGDGFLFGVGVMVALVPEGLLPTVTLSLAIGAQRMAAERALVRRLEAVETLGSTTFVCTDKTGTLTRNEMSVVAVWTPAGEVTVADGGGFDPTRPVALDATSLDIVRRAMVVARRCSDGHVDLAPDGVTWRPIGDPMEAAIDVMARRCGVGETAPADRRYPFDPRRRRMSVVHGSALSVKGAPDAVLPRCPGHEAAAGDGTAGELSTVIGRWAARGWRLLAVAESTRGGPWPDDPDVAEAGLDLVGLVAFEDPPRPGAAAAIAACRRAGLMLVMITGDHPATARAIADEVALRHPDDPVLLGADLPADDASLGALVDHDGLVLARVAPEDKLRIARALRARGHVVAMTGDGVNDGPALHEADIGVAMGRSGTDVAREAADLVLLDDDFATIVHAIEQGRATYENIGKFLTYHLTDNVAELTPFVIWALSGGNFPLAIGVLQILALDIGTDLLPALALGAELPSADVLDQRAARGPLLDRQVVRRAFFRFGPAEAVVEMVTFVVALVAAGWHPGGDLPSDTALAAASGAAFASVVLGQLATAFACRSTRVAAWRMRPTENRYLVGAVAMELLALVTFLAVPPLADVLGHRPPPLLAGCVALLAIPVVLVVDAVDTARTARRG